jgi:hypothetical protein
VALLHAHNPWHKMKKVDFLAQKSFRFSTKQSEREEKGNEVTSTVVCKNKSDPNMFRLLIKESSCVGRLSGYIYLLGVHQQVGIRLPPSKKIIEKLEKFQLSYTISQTYDGNIS